MEARHTFDPNHLGIQVYDLLSRPGIEDRERAKIIAEALETVQQNYPDLVHTATKRDLSETELRLMSEIEKIRNEIENTKLQIKEVELRLLDKIEMTLSEIENTKLAIKDVELRLTKYIESVRLDLTKDIEGVRTDLTKEIEGIRTELTKEMGKQTMKTVSYLTAIMGLFFAIMKFLPA